MMNLGMVVIRNSRFTVVYIWCVCADQHALSSDATGHLHVPVLVSTNLGPHTQDYLQVHMSILRTRVVFRHVFHLEVVYVKALKITRRNLVVDYFLCGAKASIHVTFLPWMKCGELRNSSTIARTARVVLADARWSCCDQLQSLVINVQLGFFFGGGGGWEFFARSKPSQPISQKTSLSAGVLWVSPRRFFSQGVWARPPSGQTQTVWPQAMRNYFSISSVAIHDGNGTKSWQKIKKYTKNDLVAVNPLPCCCAMPRDFAYIAQNLSTWKRFGIQKWRTSKTMQCPAHCGKFDFPCVKNVKSAQMGVFFMWFWTKKKPKHVTNCARMAKLLPISADFVATNSHLDKFGQICLQASLKRTRRAEFRLLLDASLVWGNFGPMDLKQAWSLGCFPYFWRFVEKRHPKRRSNVARTSLERRSNVARTSLAPPKTSLATTNESLVHQSALFVKKIMVPSCFWKFQAEFHRNLPKFCLRMHPVAQKTTHLTRLAVFAQFVRFSGFISSKSHQHVRTNGLIWRFLQNADEKAKNSPEYGAPCVVLTIFGLCLEACVSWTLWLQRRDAMDLRPWLGSCVTLIFPLLFF